MAQGSEGEKVVPAELGLRAIGILVAAQLAAEIDVIFYELGHLCPGCLEAAVLEPPEQFFYFGELVPVSCHVFLRREGVSDL